jgi:hypothetical protein
MAYGDPVGAVYAHLDPTSIFAGDYPLAARKINVASGQNASGSSLQYGAVLGLKTNPGAASYAAQAGNTGNATLAFGTPNTLANVQPGVYKIVFSSSTAFTVYDPKGNDLGTGVNGTAFADQIKFTTTAGGTAMVAGDTLLVTVADSYYSAASSAGGSNVGNGTLALASPAALAYAQAGAYTVTFTSTTAFEVTDPFGNPVGAGVVGTAFAQQIGFTISAGGTAFAINDTFTVTLTAQYLYELSVATATDGSQNPGCITAETIDTSTGAVACTAFFSGEFAFEELTVDASWTKDALSQAFAAQNLPIFIRSVGQAA